MIVGNNLVFARRAYASRPPPIRVTLHQLLDSPSIMLATPSYGANLCLDYVQSVLELSRECQDKATSCEVVILPGDSIVSRARNALVATFLGSGHTHLLFVDADGGFKPKDVFWLLDADKEVVCGAVPRKTAEPDFALNWLGAPWKPSNVDPRTGAFEVAGIGAAFMMIKRSALLKLIERNPGLKCAGPDYLSDAAQSSHHALFDCLVADGGYWSEDLVFCRRWRDCGGQVWVMPAMELRHHGSQTHKAMLSHVMRSRA